MINLIEQFEPILVQKYEAEQKSWALYQSNPGVGFINAKTIKLPHITASGYKDHTRTAGFNAGTLSTDWEPKTLSHDRDIEFYIDAMDVEESIVTTAANLANIFETEQGIPERDAYTFSKLFADYTDSTAGYGQTADTATLSATTILGKFDEFMASMDDAGVPEEGRILYVTPTAYRFLKEAQGMDRAIRVGEPDTVISRHIHSLDDVQVVSVPAARMKTAYDFTTGFAPATGAKQINMILVHPNSVVARVKHEYIRVFEPGSDSRTGDGYIYQNRAYWDAFLLSQRLGGFKVNAEA